MLGTSYDKLAVKRTRKELTDKVRDDWDVVLARRLRRAYLGTDNLPAGRQEQGGDSRPAQESDPDDGYANDDDLEEDDLDLSLPPRDALEWRERTYASSDASSTASFDSDEHRFRTTSQLKSSTLPQPRRTSHIGLISSPTKRLFKPRNGSVAPDGSDADEISSTDSHAREMEMARRRQERKRRRRRRQQEEMAWNTGLRDWQATRDIWCRARYTPSVVRLNPPSSENTSLSSTNTGLSDEKIAADGVDPQSTSPPPPLNPASSNNNEDTRNHTHPSLPSSLSVFQNLNAVQEIPLGRPIVPSTDPGRSNLESQYSLIYDKVVLEGLRPQVPINLSHMMPALVQGWKDNDEWPPRSATVANAVRPVVTRTAAHAAAAAATSTGKKARNISLELAEKGRRLIWGAGGGVNHGAGGGSGGGSSHASSGGGSPTKDPGDESPLPSSPLSPTHHSSEKDKGAVRRNVGRLSKVLRVGGRSSMSSHDER